MHRKEIIEKSEELKFDLIGFTPFELLESETENLKRWISNSYNAEMKYMERNLNKKLNVREILEDCESVISLGMNYNIKKKFKSSEKEGKVSRYAWGRDYHLVIWKKLDVLIKYIKTLEPDFHAKSYVDTGPVMDKAWAVRAGLGWLGKHSNVINREIGSWFFIANIFTNLRFENYDKRIPDFCGNCTACIEACPTDAIVSDYVVDSNKCISYLTIENKTAIPDEFLNKFDGWIFGCDICQDVCPWNLKFAQDTEVSDFKIVKNQSVDLFEIENMDNRAFKLKFDDSPILRAKKKGLKRNADFLKKTMNLY